MGNQMNTLYITLYIYKIISGFHGLFKQGTLSFSSYVFGNRFSMTDAMNKASKAAYISSILLSGGNMIQRFDPSVNLKEIFIEKTPYNTLNKIKKTDPEAFFYFMKSCLIL